MYHTGGAFAHNHTRRAWDNFGTYDAFSTNHDGALFCTNRGPGLATRSRLSKKQSIECERRGGAARGAPGPARATPRAVMMTRRRRSRPSNVPMNLFKNNISNREWISRISQKLHPLEKVMESQFCCRPALPTTLAARVERRSRTPANGDPQSKFEETNSRVVQLCLSSAAEPAEEPRLPTTLKPWLPLLHRAMP